MYRSYTFRQSSGGDGGATLLLLLLMMLPVMSVLAYIGFTFLNKNEDPSPPSPPSPPTEPSVDCEGNWSDPPCPTDCGTPAQEIGIWWITRQQPTGTGAPCPTNKTDTKWCPATEACPEEPDCNMAPFLQNSCSADGTKTKYSLTHPSCINEKITETCNCGDYTTDYTCDQNGVYCKWDIYHPNGAKCIKKTEPSTPAPAVPVCISPPDSDYNEIMKHWAGSYIYQMAADKCPTKTTQSTCESTTDNIFTASESANIEWPWGGDYSSAKYSDVCEWT